MPKHTWTKAVNLTFASLKGGVSKTSSCINTGAALALEGFAVRFVDMDPQASLTKWLGRPAELADSPVATDLPDVGLIPAGWELASLESGRKAETVAKEYREKLAGYEGIVLIDSPPAFGVLSMAALLLADAIIVPVEASAAAVDSFFDTLAVMDRLSVRNRLAGALVTRVDTRTGHDTSVRDYLASEIGEDNVFKTVIRQTVRVKDSTIERTPTVIFDPQATASLDYIAFTHELIERYE